ncbi:MAG: APC family permease [Clostridia bacterium]|nr:APC family permease [Clostridia bacterium]
MNNKLEKKYGLITAICMVVGIVIGSGVFFKAQDVLKYTEGNMPLGILAWAIVGIVMLICALNLANLGTHYEKVNGLVDYAEATVGKKYAYFVAWFNTFIYLPGMTSVLAWVSARYTVAIFGMDDPTTGICIALSCFYLCASYALNTLSPKLSGKFQVSTTFIKLVPLVLMAIVGTVVGLINGNTIEAFKTATQQASGGNASALFAAIVATAFAYEGWIIATSINAELKNAKRNLPIALTLGGIIIVVIYIAYYIGLAGATDIATLQQSGANAAFKAIFGNIGGTALSVLIVVSCWGTLNGLMLASTRGMYAISARNQGPKPEAVNELSPSTNMPYNSSIIGLLVCSFFLFYFYGANLMSKSIFGLFSFDSSELPIITIYGFYIPVFIMFIKKHGKENILKNVILPILGIISSAFMVFAAVYAHGITPYLKAKEAGTFSCPVLFYLIVFVIVLIIGNFFYKKNREE